MGQTQFVHGRIGQFGQLAAPVVLGFVPVKYHVNQSATIDREFLIPGMGHIALT